MENADGLCPVCILVGGRGKRLGELARDVPKPLIEVAGQPFIFHQLRRLARHGAARVVLCVGYLGEQFEQAVGDGSSFGLDVSYSYDGPKLVGTAGAVRGASDQLGPEFMVLYGDSYLRVDYRDVLRAFRAARLPALMTVLRNQGRWDTSNVDYADGLVRAHDKRSPSADMQWIDYGLAVMAAPALDVAPTATDLSDLYTELAKRGQLAGYPVSERFYEIGTPDALAEADAFLRREG